MIMNTTIQSLASIVCFVLTVWPSSPVLAQATGQVAIDPGSSRELGLRELEELALRLPDSVQPAFHLFVTPEVRVEKFDAYSEEGVTEVILAEPPGGLVVSPAFDVETIGVTVGGDFRLANSMVGGLSFHLNRAEYDFKVGTVTVPRQRSDVPRFFVAEPLNRSFDEYGITLSTGYTGKQWGFILSGGYSGRPNIAIERRELSFVCTTSSPVCTGEIEIEDGAERFASVRTKGDTTSNLFWSEIGFNQSISIEGAGTIQNLISFGYQLEKVDRYTENFVSADRFQKIDKFIQLVPSSESEIVSTVRRFNDQDIISIPLRIGSIFHAPFHGGFDALGLRMAGVSFGFTFTHDFSDQKRTVVGERIELPKFSISYTERNRNRDFLSALGSVSFEILSVKGAMSFQHDMGFDERKRASIFSLQVLRPF